MFKFLSNHNNPYRRLYPSFQKRLFASLVDITLALLLLIPILNFAYSITDYDAPSKQLQKIMAKVANQSHNAKSSLPQKLIGDSEYREFMKNYGYKSIVIDQMIQLGLLGLVIFIFWLNKYATPGKMLLSMKIVDVKTFNDPSVFQLVVRLCSYLIFGLGIFYIPFNKKHRAWHDIISGTVVVNTKELKKYSASTSVADSEMAC